MLEGSCAAVRGHKNGAKSTMGLPSPPLIHQYLFRYFLCGLGRSENITAASESTGTPYIFSSYFFYVGEREKWQMNNLKI